MLASGKKEKLIPHQISTAYAAIVFFHIESPFKSKLGFIKDNLEFFCVWKRQADVAFSVLRELLWKL
jgi:hypothetical protein